MKKAIKALWQGIKDVVTVLVGWVTSLLGMNDNSKYSCILRHAIGTAATVFVVVWAISVVWSFGHHAAEQPSLFVVGNRGGLTKAAVLSLS